MAPRALLLVLSLVLAAPLVADAQQQAGRMPHIGFLAIGTPQLPYFTAFREGLREVGYIEGHNSIVVARFSEAVPGLAELAAELV